MFLTSARPGPRPLGGRLGGGEGPSGLPERAWAQHQRISLEGSASTGGSSVTPALRPYRGGHSACGSDIPPEVFRLSLRLVDRIRGKYLGSAPVSIRGLHPS